MAAGCQTFDVASDNDAFMTLRDLNRSNVVVCLRFDGERSGFAQVFGCVRKGLRNEKSG